MANWFESTFGSDPEFGANAALSGHRTLRRGMRSAEVGVWQALLGDVKVDNIFGPLTEASTKHLQRAHGEKPDGIVGPRTWAIGYGGGAAAPPSAVNEGHPDYRPATSIDSARKALSGTSGMTGIVVHREKKVPLWGWALIYLLGALGIAAGAKAISEARRAA